MAVGDSGGWVRRVRGEREKTVDEEQDREGGWYEGYKVKGTREKNNRAWPFFFFIFLILWEDF